MTPLAGLLVCLLMGSASADPAAVQAIRAHLVNLDPPLDRLTPAEREDVSALYAAGGDAPLWVGGSGRPTVEADEALRVIARAGDDGLDPAVYHHEALERLSAALNAPAPEAVAAFDVTLSSGLLRFLRHLHMGRVDPRTIGFKLNTPADRHDFPSALRSALADHRLTELLAELTPPLAQYRDLRAALATYRLLAAGPTLDPLPPLQRTVRPGEPYAALGGLYLRLAAFGDIASGTPGPPGDGVYSGAIVDGVKRFQRRHGLDADGALGQKTHAALNVPVAWRVRQIELALERLRWLPHVGDRRLVLINIPMFRLWAWDAVREDRAPSVSMAVIVGRAISTQTPVFAEDMREVVFRPFWNVPRSILRHETLPAIERDPEYLAKQNMEIVRGEGDDARRVDASAENLLRLRQGELRVRQRPGPRNSLGLIKFVFPNDDNVYMHGTPATALFSQSRRDFSHGCVRVEDPVALAEWTLRDRPEWTRDRIQAAMDGAPSTHASLAQPIHVILFYTTAAVMPEDGTIRFAEDIYRHDLRLERALPLTPLTGAGTARARTPPPPSSR